MGSDGSFLGKVLIGIAVALLVLLMVASCQPSRTTVVSQPVPSASAPVVVQGGGSSTSGINDMITGGMLGYMLGSSSASKATAEPRPGYSYSDPRPMTNPAPMASTPAPMTPPKVSSQTMSGGSSFRPSSSSVGTSFRPSSSGGRR